VVDIQTKAHKRYIEREDKKLRRRRDIQIGRLKRNGDASSPSRKANKKNAVKQKHTATAVATGQSTNQTPKTQHGNSSNKKIPPTIPIFFPPPLSLHQPLSQRRLRPLRFRLVILNRTLNRVLGEHGAMQLHGWQTRSFAISVFFILPASSSDIPRTSSVRYEELAIADPQPNVLNFTSEIVFVALSTRI